MYTLFFNWLSLVDMLLTIFWFKHFSFGSIKLSPKIKMIDVQEIIKLIAPVGIQIVILLMEACLVGLHHRDTVCLGRWVLGLLLSRGRVPVYSLLPGESLIAHSGRCADWEMAVNTPRGSCWSPAWGFSVSGWHHTAARTLRKTLSFPVSCGLHTVPIHGCCASDTEQQSSLNGPQVSQSLLGGLSFLLRWLWGECLLRGFFSDVSNNISEPWVCVACRPMTGTVMHSQKGCAPVGAEPCLQHPALLTGECLFFLCGCFPCSFLIFIINACFIWIAFWSVVASDSSWCLL